MQETWGKCWLMDGWWMVYFLYTELAALDSSPHGTFQRDSQILHLNQDVHTQAQVSIYNT